MRRFAAVLVSAVFASGLVTAAPALAAGEQPPPREEAPVTGDWGRSASVEVLPDGRRRASLHPGPAFRRTPDGWAKADPKVRPSADAALPLAAENGLRPVRFGRSAQRLIDLDLADGTVVVSAPGLSVGTPELVGGDVVYRDVAPDTDLVVTNTVSGVRSRFVLRSERAPRTFRLRLSDPKGVLGEVSESGDGGYRFDGVFDGDLSLRLDPAFAYEHKDGELPGVEPGSARMRVTRSGRGFDVEKSVDEAWLAGKSYPIVLDPSISFYGGPVADCHLVGGTNTSHETTSYCSASPMEAGYGNSTSPYKRRAILHFYTQTSNEEGIPANARIESSTLKLYASNKYFTTGSVSLAAYRLYEWGLGFWSNNATWRTRNGSAAWSVPGAPFGTTAYSSQSLSATSAYYTWSIPALTQGWVDGTIPNDGVMIKAPNEATVGVMRFVATDSATVWDQSPRLDVVYSLPPGPVSNVSAAAGNQSATVSWTAATDNGGSPITSHTVHAYDASGTFVKSVTASGTATSATVPGLTAGVSYTFKVQTHNAAGDGAVSTASNAVTPYAPPGKPTGVTAARGDTKATVSWTAAPSNGATITKYTVTSNPGAVSKSTTSGTATSLVFDGLANGTSYTFTVTATNAAGTGLPSDPSNAVTPAGAPTAPTGVQATAGDKQATVTWTASSGNGAPVLDYTVTASPGGQSVTTANGTTTSAVVPGLTNGTSYTFTVRARNDVAPGAVSAPSNAVVPAGGPGAVTPVTAERRPGAAVVRWTAADPNGSAVTKYTVSTFTSDGTFRKSEEAAGTATSHTVGGLTNGVAYYFEVYATNGVGNGTAGRSGTVTPADVPGSPAPVTAVAGDKSAVVSWAEAAANGAPVLGYTVEVYRGTTLERTIVGSDPAKRTEQVGGLSNEQAYTFRVFARNDVGNGVSASSGSVSPAGVPVVAKVFRDGATGTPRYEQGDRVPFEVRVTNPDAGAPMPGIAVTDIPSGTLTVRPDSVRVGGQSCAAAGVTCSVVEGVLRVEGVSVPAGGVVAVTYDADAAGNDRGCAVAGNGAAATNRLGISSATSTVSLLVCGPGLGMEPWWQYVSAATGPQSSAAVNVANGNLVLQATDSTPVQARGRLAYVQRRTYNSQAAALLGASPDIGAGWTLNLGHVDTVAGLGAVGRTLVVPRGDEPGSAALALLAVGLVDRDGTRHTFTPKAGLPPVDVAALPATRLAPLTPKALQLPAGYARLCVDVAYQAPAGVHLGLWRYVATKASSCAAAAPTDTVVAGFAAVRPDRVRTEYDATGRLLSMSDANGVELRYRYETVDGVTRLAAVYEPRSCADATAGSIPATCRAFRLTYAAGEVAVTDPARRTTRYLLDSATPARLVAVVNPDGSRVDYTYGTCGGGANALCSATDPRGALTRFAYAAGPASSGAMPRVTTITDRRGTVTDVSYPNDAETRAARGGRVVTYSGIDSRGRVSQVDEGDGAAVLRRSHYVWDSATVDCREPGGGVDNLLCVKTRDGLGRGQSERTDYLYNVEGMVLRERKHLAATTIDTTFGYRSQYVSADGSVATYDDTVTGGGNVTSATGAGGTRDSANVLYAISDRRQQLTPEGNAPQANVTAHLTEFSVDANPDAPAGAPVADGTCADPAVATGNTGNVCEVSAPSVDGIAKARTRHTYDAFGQRTSTASPRAVAETPATGTPPATRYTYFTDDAAVLDLSGQVRSGGWLRAVTDPEGNFVAFGYDAAGNVVRTWDRNATRGKTVTSFPGTLAAPPVATYTETVYGSIAAPWRYATRQRNQLDQATVTTVDANGNATSVRPARGVAGNTAKYDVVSTYDAGDLVLTTTTPSQRQQFRSTTYTYDARGNRVTTTDANGNVRITRYDLADRVTGTVWSRGVYVSGQVGKGCRSWTPADAPIPSDREVCETKTEYDAVDNVVAETDGSGARTTMAYDAARRLLERVTPRADGAIASVKSAYVYDLDGNVLTECSPREFTEGSKTCTRESVYAKHTTYNAGGKPTRVRTFRANGQPVDVDMTYNADGDQITTTDGNRRTTTTMYDLLNRRLYTTVPRSSAESHTTYWRYDPVGNVTAVVKPAPAGHKRITAYSYDAANRLKDTVTGSDSEVAADAGLVSADGGRNARTRMVYDADGHVVATFEARAFATSTTTPDPRYMMRTEFDDDGRATATYVPRHAGDADLPPGQTGECSAANRPEAADGVPGYPAGTVVCVTRVTFDAGGRAATVRWPTSNGTDLRYARYTYTDDNLVASVELPSPAVETPTGDDDARVLTQVTRYDGAGRPVSVTQPLDRTTTTEYTADGLVSRVVEPAGDVRHKTETAYDAAGQPTAVTTYPTVSDLDKRVARTRYYADGLVHEREDSGGNVTRYVYDSNGNTTKVFSPSAVARDKTNEAGRATENDYTWDNLLLESRQPISPTGGLLRRTRYAYDAGGRKTSESVAEVDGATVKEQPGSALTFGYHWNDLLAYETGRNGERIERAYDPAGHLASVTDTTSGSSTVQASYYLDGLVREVVAAGRSVEYAYDGAGHVAARTVGSAVTTITYGNAGLPRTMTSDVAAGTTSWTYDEAGRPVGRTNGNGTRLTWQHNADDTLRRQTLANTAGAVLAQWSYSYDGLRRQLSQDYAGSGGIALATDRHEVTYDAAGRLASFKRGLAAATPLTWDADGNRLSFGSETFAYRADDALATFTSGGVTQQVSYEPFGGTAQSGCVKHSYDGFDRVVATATHLPLTGGGSCAATAASEVTSAYDGLDRQRRTTTTKGTTTTTTALHYDGLGNALVAQAPTGGTERFYQLDAAGVPLALAPAGTPSSAEYLHDDGQGNISTVTSTAMLVSCAARFDPFGTPLGASGENTCASGSSENDVWYRGARRDRTTGNYQFGARTYDPAKAAFLTPDSYRNAQPDANLALGTDPLTRNRYGYVNGDPVNYADPSGHEPRPTADGGWSGNGCAQGCTAPTGPTQRDVRAAEDYACWNDFSCTTADWDGMSALMRRNFIHHIHRTYGEQYNIDDWFNAIDAVLQFASEKEWDSKGSWFSLIDAGILGGIHDGLALFLGHSNVVRDEFRGDVELYAENPGARLWQDFFEYRAGLASPDDEKGRSMVLWGEAEQAATEHGVWLADVMGAEGDEFQLRWFGLTEWYRSAIRHPTIRGNINKFNGPFPDFDVTNREASYEGVHDAWDTALILYGIEEAQKYRARRGY